jgi:hypothetical protein
MTSDNQKSFEWGSVFAGSALAISATLILSQFGAVIGLSSDGVLAGRVTLAHWAVIATGIWLLWVQLIASVLGGYISGRMRNTVPEMTPFENELKDGVYGLVTWDISTIAVFVIVGLGTAFGLLIDSLNGSLAVPTELTNKEQNTVIIYAFILGATSLISSVASWWAATVGGDHRDKHTDFTKVISFK